MVFKKIKTYANLVMFSHTLFSLPFAMISMLWAAEGIPPLNTVFWILVALVGARNGANALNRLIDWKIDAKNPRTSNRHIPQGIVKRKEALLLIIICFAIMFIAAVMLNPLCVKLFPLAVLIFIFYSYTKRFTWLCHLILGVACGGAPVGAWIAVKEEIGIPSLILGAASLLWVAGFDIIYGILDIEFDRSEGLYSIPAVFGAKNALFISSIFHLLAMLALIFLYFFMNMGVLYVVGIIICFIILIIEHIIVTPVKLERIKTASYTLNQLMGCIFFIFTAADIFI